MAEDVSVLTDTMDMKIDALNVELKVLKRAVGSGQWHIQGPTDPLR